MDELVTFEVEATKSFLLRFKACRISSACVITALFQRRRNSFDCSKRIFITIYFIFSYNPNAQFSAILWNDSFEIQRMFRNNSGGIFSRIVKNSKEGRKIPTKSMRISTNFKRIAKESWRIFGVNTLKALVTKAMTMAQYPIPITIQTIILK